MDYRLGFGSHIAKTLNLTRTRSRMIDAAKRPLSALYCLRLRKYPELRTLIETFQASRSMAINPDDMIHLYETVIERMPKYLLDIGAGTSTNVIALAIDELQRRDPCYKPTFIAIEEDPFWTDYHRRTFYPGLLRHVDLMNITASIHMVDGVKTACYNGIPSHPYEFVHVDGPNLTAHGCIVSSDPLTLRYGARAIMLFDGREATARFIAQRLTDFTVSRHPFVLSYRLTKH